MQLRLTLHANSLIRVFHHFYYWITLPISPLVLCPVLHLLGHKHQFSQGCG
jgi:hypothetical protein